MIKSVKLLVGSKEIELSLDEALQLRDDLNKMHEGVFPPSVKEVHWYWPYYQPVHVNPFPSPYHVGDLPYSHGTITSGLGGIIS